MLSGPKVNQVEWIKVKPIKMEFKFKLKVKACHQNGERSRGFQEDGRDVKEQYQTVGAAKCDHFGTKTT